MKLYDYICKKWAFQMRKGVEKKITMEHLTNYLKHSYKIYKL